MTKEALTNLEKLVNYMAFYFLKKASWQDVTKIEWMHIAGEVNKLLQKKRGNKKGVLLQEPLGENYFYEHLIIKKLKPWKSRKPIASLSIPSFTRLNTIANALGFDSYIEFINSAADAFSFHELKINIPVAIINKALLDSLVGYWYCYNRNLPFHPQKTGEERIWRSAMEVYKSGDEYFVERTGKDNHKYYGKITAYDDYIFIIMNSTTFIRQRHFISRIKDVADKLKRAGYSINQLSFISTCVSFNEEPIALHEIFDRVTNIKQLNKASVDLAPDSPLLPKHIKLQLEDIESNRITQH